MINFYKFLNCHDLFNIQNDVLHNFVNKETTNELAYIGDGNLKLSNGLHAFLKEYDLHDKVRAYALNYVSGKNGIHIDTGESDYTIVVPISNCQGSLLNFYSCVGEPQLRSSTVNNKLITYKFYPDEICQFVDSVCIENAPCLIRINYPHNIKITGTSTRVTLIIRFFKKDNDYLEKLITATS